MSKKLLLKLLDSGMFKFSQHTTWTSIAQILSGISYFQSHDNIIKIGSATVSYTHLTLPTILRV